jgi:transcription elongation GreA/GreB family factor
MTLDMKMLRKKELIENMIARLEAELAAVVQAAKAAHEAATHESAKPENQYDTRGLEASYLAGAQAARAGEIQTQLALYHQMPTADLPPGSRVAAGALVQLEAVAGGRRSYCLLVPRGGGASLTVDDIAVQAVAPASPMGEVLMGSRAGETIEVESREGAREYRILGVS